MKLKKFYKKIRNKILLIWGKIGEDKQKQITERAEFILNYLVNSILLSVPFYIFSYFVFGTNYSRWFLIIICLWISLPFIEHYYIWFREGWKKEIDL